MSESAPPLLPIFRSAAQLALLTELFTSDGREQSIGELVRRTGVPQATISREVARLRAAGLLEDREIGRTRLVRARRESPVHAELAALLMKVGGPPVVLRDVLATVPGIHAAYIYGSWARRRLGEPGDEPADIDVLVVMDADDRATAVHGIRAAADEATARLGRDVSISILTDAEWTGSHGGFVSSVREAPLVPIELRQLA